MKPISQTEFDGIGNWYTACLASMLELPLSDIPHLSGQLNFEQTWFDRTQAWLLTRNMYAVVLEDDEPANGYYIAIGTNYGGVAHGVICLDGLIVHDPHPARAGLIGAPDIRIIIKRFNNTRSHKAA